MGFSQRARGFPRLPSFKDRLPMMSSGSMASYRAAMPPEMFGEPDFDEPRWIQPKCQRCGAFYSWKGSVTERCESYYGAIEDVTAWPCKRCGGTAFSVVDTVGKVYGPLPPWSDPYMVWNEALDAWEHYLAEDAREMEGECGSCIHPRMDHNSETGECLHDNPTFGPCPCKGWRPFVGEA